MPYLGDLELCQHEPSLIEMLVCGASLQALMTLEQMALREAERASRECFELPARITAIS